MEDEHITKLTEESAKALKVGKAMKGSSDGVSRAIATTSKGKITKILEFTKPGSMGSMLTNPAMLAGAAGIMAQLAMQQTMEEITEYLNWCARHNLPYSCGLWRSHRRCL